ncbi:hypothetical protein [Spiroplasma poulsonii]|uniref:hypothetical protein n=1 Tax=Spiroplasma poulsonii TaxID=2138 RepID=UPI001F4CCB58|nr:hypothetical protein [Spiroplasma poulsonii]UNF61647.1 hypothetical protein MNU24_06970 [Spiroplasma poulsonii]
MNNQYFDKFDGFEYATFHCYDISIRLYAKIARRYFPYLGYKIKMFKAKTSDILNKEAGIINRVTWIRKMFVQGKIYGTLDNFPFLDKCISELGWVKINWTTIMWSKDYN